MGKRLLLISGFFIFTPLLILTLVMLSLYYRYESNKRAYHANNTLTSSVNYQALPENKTESVLGVDSEDARVAVLEEFFDYYDSPLKPHSGLIVKLADEHGIDYRYVPAIAMKESTLCKKTPKDSYNCWGYGIYGDKVTRFENYEEGIETVTRGLAKNYFAKGYTNPEEIMSKYTPSSNGSWAATVTLIMNRIEQSL